MNPVVVPHLKREIWLCRHGETEWSLSKQHTSRTDKPLTETGKQQARALANQLNGRKFYRVYTSPLSRARDTCEIAGYSNQAVIDPNLSEYDYGDLEGRTTVDIQTDIPNWAIWSGPVPGGESLLEVGRRVQAFIDRCLQESSIDQTNHDPILVFAHGHVLRILAAVWIGLEPDAGKVLALNTATLSKLGWEHDNRVINEWNVSPKATSTLN